jgi:hypothetical protein
MSSNAGKNGATVVGRPSRPWSLFARLAAFYTLGLTALILVTMVILYSVLVQRKASNIDLWRKMVFVDVGARRT